MTIRRGEGHGNAKLTEEDVRRIRFFPPKTKLLAIQFHYPYVSTVCLHKIRTGKTWSHVEPKSAREASLLVSAGKAQYVRPV